MQLPPPQLESCELDTYELMWHLGCAATVALRAATTARVKLGDVNIIGRKASSYLVHLLHDWSLVFDYRIVVIRAIV